MGPNTKYGNFVVTAITADGIELEHYCSANSYKLALLRLTEAVKSNWNGHSCYKVTKYLGRFVRPEDCVLQGYTPCD